MLLRNGDALLSETCMHLWLPTKACYNLKIMMLSWHTWDVAPPEGRGFLSSCLVCQLRRAYRLPVAGSCGMCGSTLCPGGRQRSFQL